MTAPVYSFFSSLDIYVYINIVDILRGEYLHFSTSKYLKAFYTEHPAYLHEIKFQSLRKFQIHLNQQFADVYSIEYDNNDFHSNIIYGALLYTKCNANYCIFKHHNICVR